MKKYEIPRHKLVLMTKAFSCVGEQQFNAYPFLEELKRSKDYVNQFGEQDISATSLAGVRHTNYDEKVSHGLPYSLP